MTVDDNKLTRKLAQIILGRLCIQPMIFACLCAASTMGNPVMPSFQACSLSSSVSHCDLSGISVGATPWPFVTCLHVRELLQERSAHAHPWRKCQNMVVEVAMCNFRISENGRRRRVLPTAMQPEASRFSTVTQDPKSLKTHLLHPHPDPRIPSRLELATRQRLGFVQHHPRTDNPGREVRAHPGRRVPIAAISR